MNFKKSTFIYLILILAALAAVIISGGGDLNEPDNYRNAIVNEIAERLSD